MTWTFVFGFPRLQYRAISLPWRTIRTKIAKHPPSGRRNLSPDRLEVMKLH